MGGSCKAQLIHGQKGLGVGLTCRESVQDAFLPLNCQTLGLWDPSWRNKPLLTDDRWGWALGQQAGGWDIFFYLVEPFLNVMLSRPLLYSLTFYPLFSVLWGWMSVKNWWSKRWLGLMRLMGLRWSIFFSISTKTIWSILSFSLNEETWKRQHIWNDSENWAWNSNTTLANGQMCHKIKWKHKHGRCHLETWALRSSSGCSSGAAPPLCWILLESNQQQEGNQHEQKTSLSSATFPLSRDKFKPTNLQGHL